MATHTPNYNLRKPATTDTVNVGLDIGANMDIIDAALAAKAEEEHAHEEYATDAEVTTAVNNAVTGVVDAAPAALDTLNELAAALNDDSNFASSVTTSLAGKSDTGHAHAGTYEPSGAIATHAADTTAVHGIADTALLITAAAHALIDHDDLPGIEANIPIQAEAPADPEEFDLWIDSDEPAISGGGGGGATILQQDDEPASPAEGDLWIDTDAEPSGLSAWTQVVSESGASFTNWTAAQGAGWSSTGTVITTTNVAEARAKYNNRVATAYCVAEVEMRMISGSGAAQFMGLLVGWDGTSGVGGGVAKVSFNGTATWTYQLEKTGQANFGNITGTGAYGTWRTIRLAFTGGGGSYWVDGTLVQSTGGPLSTTDASFVGLYAANAVVEYRNFKVWTLTWP